MSLDLTGLFNVGDTFEKSFIVEEQHSASHIGSGDLLVFSTPSMILAMEATSHELLAAKLPDSHSSVGVTVNIRHLAPTPVGKRVTINAEIIGIDRAIVEFSVSAKDEVEQIGDGSHKRAVIDVERFQKRVASKE